MDAKGRIREQLKNYPLFLSRKDVAEILGINYLTVPGVVKNNNLNVIGTPNKFKINKEVFIDFVAGKESDK
jgi:hypothetical protein